MKPERDETGNLRAPRIPAAAQVDEEDGSEKQQQAREVREREQVSSSVERQVQSTASQAIRPPEGGRSHRPVLEPCQ